MKIPFEITQRWVIDGCQSVQTNEPNHTTIMTTYPSTFTAQLAPLDTPTTFLVKHSDGSFSIQWAGCFYGPSENLSDIANGDLLILAELTAANEATEWREAGFSTCDELGPIEIPETITAAELNNLFFAADWKFEGAKVTALHGLDLSTEERFASAEEGSVLITVLRPNGVSTKVMVASDAVFTR